MGARGDRAGARDAGGAGGYAREMTEDRAQRQRDLLAPYIAAADALITTAAVPGRQAPLLVTGGDGRADEARLGGRGPRRRDRRQRRGRPAGQGGAHRRRQVWGGANVPVADAGPGLPALRPERRQPGDADDPAASEGGAFAPDFDDEIVAGSCVTHDGAVRHEPTRAALEGETRMSEPVVWLTIFVLSVFVGVEVISKVSSTLHTPLMSGANAIHGIILLGAILVTGYAETTSQLVIGLVAVVLASVNMVGGFVVTDRMLQMFTRKQAAADAEDEARVSGTPVWVQLAYLVAAVCFILALKGLSSPRTRARGNLIGAVGAVSPASSSSSTRDLDHVVPILVAIAVGYGGRVRRRPPGADDPDAAARGAVQRCRRRRRGAGRAARAARRRAAPAPARFTLAATAFTILVGSVSFAGSLVTFAKLQELMTSRPVVVPRPAGGVRRGAARRARAGRAHRDPAGGVGRRGARAGRPAARRAAGAAGRRRRRTDRDLAAQRVHRPDRRGGRLRAGQHGAAGRRHPGRRERHVPDQADGLGDGPVGRQHPVRRAQGRLHLGAGEASDRPVRSAGPEDVAILLGYAARVIIVPGYGLAVAQAQHTLRELVDLLGERGVDGGLRHPPGRRPDARPHERAAGRGAGALRAAQGDGRHQPASSSRPTSCWSSAPTTSSTRRRRTTPGAPIYGMPILNVDEAQQVVFLKRSMRPGLRRHRERAALRPEDHAAVR